MGKRKWKLFRSNQWEWKLKGILTCVKFCYLFLRINLITKRNWTVKTEALRISKAVMKSMNSRFGDELKEEEAKFMLSSYIIKNTIVVEDINEEFYYR